MNGHIIRRLQQENDAARSAGTFKQLRVLQPRAGAKGAIDGYGDVLVMCSNDYQGLAKSEAVVAAAVEATKTFGVGPASVRFICGTLPVHEALESALAKFLETETAITFSSAWAANTGLYAVLAGPGDVILSDSLNHASIIDGCRMTGKGVLRDVYPHSDVVELEALLRRYRDHSGKIIVTDGVFSMEGDLAPLAEISRLAEEYGALLVVDDSHGLGVIGPTGRGTPEHFGLLDKVDIHVGTLGKALGGGAGGFVAGPHAVIDALIQKARPHLFSNAVPPGVAAASTKAIEIIDREPHLMASLAVKTVAFRGFLRDHNIKSIPREAAIVPILIGQSSKSARVSTGLLKAGILATSFAFPVVPEGEARIRLQVSQSHSMDELAWAAKTIAGVIRSVQ